VISVTLVGQSASKVRRTSPAKGHENDSELTFPLAKTGAISERFGSGDGEHKTLLTRQIAFEPLSASVFALGWLWILVIEAH
jgi:hypothetical protein